MRRSLVPLVFLAILLLSFSQEAVAPWFTRNYRFEYSYYDNTKQVVGTAVAEVKQVYERNDSIFSVADVTYSGSDGATTGKGQFFFSRDSLSFTGEMTNLLPPKIRYDNVEDVKITGKALDYPLSPDTGMALPGSRAVMVFNRPGQNSVMLYEIVNRRVAGVDTLQLNNFRVPCWVITCDEHIRPEHLKAGEKPRERSVKEWYHPAYGVMRIDYYKSGDLELTRILVSVSQ